MKWILVLIIFMARPVSEQVGVGEVVDATIVGTVETLGVCHEIGTSIVDHFEEENEGPLGATYACMKVFDAHQAQYDVQDR